MEVKARVRELRLKAGYTQYVVAQFLQISQKTCSDYEIGKAVIPAKKMVKLAELYDVSLDYLFCLTDTPAPFPGKRDLSRLDPNAIEYNKWVWEKF